MRYPNLTAEYEATGYHISVLAEQANVTEDLMHDILYGDALPTVSEASSLLRLFSNSGYKIKYQYLFAPSLALIRPHKNKYRIELLHWKLEQANKLVFPHLWEQMKREKARRVLDTLRAGKPVLWAAYRDSMYIMGLLMAIENKRQSAPRRLPIIA